MTVLQSAKPSALRWKVMVASGNDCVHFSQTFTLAVEQNIKFDREWVFFSPHEPKISHVHSHAVKVFLQRWSGYFGKGKKYAFPEWQGDSYYNYWVILGPHAYKTTLWQIWDIRFIIIHHKLAFLPPIGLMSWQKLKIFKNLKVGEFSWIFLTGTSHVNQVVTMYACVFFFLQKQTIPQINQTEGGCLSSRAEYFCQTS